MEQAANLNTPLSNQSVNQLKRDPAGWFKKNIIKIVIAVLVIAVAAELYLGSRTLFLPSKSGSAGLSLLPPKVNNLSEAGLSLIADKISYKKGEAVSVNVKLFTGGYTTDSTDLVVKYDPKFLEPKAGTFAQQGQTYSEYPALQVDKAKGLIGISGITLPGKKGFSGVGSFAKLNFTALQDGQTQIIIEFQPGKTADSNVVLSGSSKDILGNVANADILISETGNQADAASSGEKCQSFTQYCQDAEGASGTQVCSAGSLKLGICGYDPVNTVSCDICKI